MTMSWEEERFEHRVHSLVPNFTVRTSNSWSNDLHSAALQELITKQVVDSLVSGFSIQWARETPPTSVTVASCTHLHSMLKVIGGLCPEQYSSAWPQATSWALVLGDFPWGVCAIPRGLDAQKGGSRRFMIG